MAAEDSLLAAATALLAVAGGILAATAAGVPSRVFLANGDVPFDCPSQLSVHTTTIDRAATSPAGTALDRSQVKYPILIRAGLVVTALREVPVAVETQGTIVLPDVSAMDAAAAVQMTDGWALYTGVLAIHLAGGLVGESWRSLDVGPATPVATSGAAGGWQVPVLVSLDAQL